MKYLSRTREILIGRLTFPLTNYLYNRRRILSTYRSLISSEKEPGEVIRELQLHKLKKLVKYAYENIPYYHEKIRKSGLVPEDITSLKDVEAIPPLDRQEVIDHHKEMVALPFKNSIYFSDSSGRDPGSPILFAPFKRHKLVRNTSSGSTGAPTVFYEDGSVSALNWAHELRLKRWFGLSPGAKEARFVRLSTDYMPSQKIVKMRKMLWGQLLLPGLNLSDEDYAFCLDQILRYRPQVLWGFTSALAGIADYVLRSNVSLGNRTPKLIVGWAAPMYEHEESTIREAFNCEVSNIYGAREVGHIAGRCPKGQFHVNQESLLVEVEREGRGDDNCRGELLVTTLLISPMPFIRYRMGDIGELTFERCSCGRSLQVLKELVGRTGEVFATKEGRMIAPNFWCRVFMSGKVSGAVRRFQVVYTRSKNIKIIIERGDSFSKDVEDYLREVVAKNFSQDTVLELEYVHKIEPDRSGKYQMIINEAM